jgi:hypothetical protein
MKKEQLKQIIKEELQAMLNEMDEDSTDCKKLEKEYDDLNKAGYGDPGGYSEMYMSRKLKQAKGKGCKWSANL